MATTEEIRSHQFYESGLYDPVQVHIKTIPYINKIYGTDILDLLTTETVDARRLRKVHPEEAFSEELVKRMRSIALEKFPTCNYEKIRPVDEKH